MSEYGQLPSLERNQGSCSSRTPMRNHQPDTSSFLNEKSRNYDDCNRTITNPERAQRIREAERDLRKSVSSMIREKTKNDGKIKIQDSYNPLFKPHVYCNKWKKDKIPDMYDMIKKRAMQTPSPDKYSKVESMKVPQHYAGFSKVKRVSYIDTIMAEKKKIPGPNSYKPKYPKSKCTLFVSRTRAGNAFIDDATYRGQQTPGIQNVKYTSIEKKPYVHKITKSKRGSFLDPITRNKSSPGACKYKAMESYDATQKKKISLYLPKQPKKTLTDEVLRTKKAVPGVGKYLSSEKDVYKFISKGSGGRRGRFG
ncbi:unnamed protein product [Moneuplotes crassus]|uniref:Uncharacterized protein n=1 Tax=Euplotes crassus TaxID=5936 RepID=A0AAD1UE06_EUPCR|nr:unnamed protein product [Moneuplotes crassus]